MVNPRFGNQKPTFELSGKYAYSDGDEAIELFRNYGATFYPSQEYELELFLARNEDDSFACLSIYISKPRQNGKSYGARWYSIWASLIEGKRVLFSAHHGKTVRKMFKAICSIVESNEDIKSELLPSGQGIYRAQGLEGIYFTNGGCIEFQTRTASGGRGDTYDVIIIDEAQELTDAQLEALKPTTLASESGDPQMIYLGTPPGPECSGTVFRHMHDRAHDGSAPNIWWLEWAVDEIPDMSNTESVLDLAYKTNPAMGYRIRERVMRDAIETATDPAGFAREYLGWWSKQAVINAVLDTLRWQTCKTSKPPKTGIVSFGVKFSLDGQHVALAACLKPSRGKPHIEVVSANTTARGITRLAKSLASRKSDIAVVVIDGRAKSELLERRLRDSGFLKKQIKVCQTKDVTAACSMLEDAVNEGTITHFDQPGLNDSAANSTRRKVGGSGGWAFDGSNPLPIEACALALNGALTTKRDPKKKARVG